MANSSGHMTPAASPAPADRPLPDRASDWRGALRAHARAAFLAGERGGENHPGARANAVGLSKAREDLLAQLSAGLGPLAREAIEIIEAFATGASRRRPAALRQQAPSRGHDCECDLPPEFESQLEIVLNGLAPELASAGEQAPAPAQSIQSELWQLLFKVRESAEMSYAREIDLVELDRRIILMLRATGPLVPAEIASATGVDKAQVSRSVRRLLEIKVVERGQIRAPLVLSRKGRALSDRLVRLAQLRNRELTLGIPDDHLASFSAVIEKLLLRAVALYDQEHARGADEGATLNPFPIDPDDRPGQPMRLDRTRIISPLMTLSAYFSRSGALTFKRLTGLSNFETWVLNEIGRDAPMEWHTLVERLDRDHSQAGRTVRALVAKGLVVREGRPGRRHGRFSLTARGREVFGIIQNASQQRSAFLMAPLSRDERARFLSIFGQIHRNALVQLERERTFEELDARMSAGG